MRKIAIVMHGLGLCSMALVISAFWVFFFTHGHGNYWQGTLRIVFDSYYIPGVVLIVVTSAGIPVCLLSGARVAQLLLRNNAWLARWHGLRFASNTLLAVVALVAVAQLPEDDAIAAPVRRFLSGGEKAGNRPALPPDAELDFPALPQAAPLNPLETLELHTPDGQTLKLADWRGKAVFLNFWATWCNPCRAEMPNIETLFSNMDDHPDVVFALVSAESQETVNAFREKHGLSAPLYTASENALKQLKIRSFPTTWILSKTGDIVFEHTGAAAWDGGTTQAFLQALVQDTPFVPPKNAAQPTAEDPEKTPSH